MVYERILVMLLPQLFSTVVKTLITFFNETGMWEMETYVTSCIKKILLICKDSHGVINYLLDIVEISENCPTASDILKIIQNLFTYGDWAHMDHYLLYRFLELYRRSTMNEEFESLRWCLESCIRQGFTCMKRNELVTVVSVWQFKIISKCNWIIFGILCWLWEISVMMNWVVAVNPAMTLKFAKVMEYAAGTQNSEPYSLSLEMSFMYSLLELISSPNRYLSLLGCRLVFLTLDRLKNGSDLLRAKIFFPTGEFPVKIGQYDERDNRFIQEINDVLQTSLLTALLNHGFHLKSVEMIFGVIAAIIVEVPSSFSAAVGVSFAMAAQELVLTAPDDLEEAGYRIHACVVFLVSLVCYVHRAEVSTVHNIKFKFNSTCCIVSGILSLLVESDRIPCEKCTAT